MYELLQAPIKMSSEKGKLNFKILIGFSRRFMNVVFRGLYIDVQTF